VHPEHRHESLSGNACDNSSIAAIRRRWARPASATRYADATEAAVADYEAAGMTHLCSGVRAAKRMPRCSPSGKRREHRAPGSTPYYAVSDTNELSDALRTIGAHVAITCDSPLSNAPANQFGEWCISMTGFVPSSDKDGWHYTGERASNSVVMPVRPELGGRADVQVLEGLSDRSG